MSNGTTIKLVYQVYIRPTGNLHTAALIGVMMQILKAFDLSIFIVKYMAKKV